MTSSESTIGKRNTILSCWIAAIAAGCLLLMAAGAGAAWYFWPTPTVHMSIAITAPEQVQADTDFNLTIRVTNNGNATITVTEIRLPQAITDVATPEQAEPSFLGFQQQDKQTVCQFSQRVEGGATLPFTIKMHAQQDGEVSGVVEVTADAQNQSGSLRMAVIMPTTTPRPQPSVTPTRQPDLHPVASVVQIFALVKNANGNLQPAWSGSGSVVSPDGYILTNHHVAMGSGDIPVAALMIYTTDRQDVETKPKYIAEVAGADENLDLAVLHITQDASGTKIDATKLNLPALPIGDPKKLMLNDNLFILGYPGVGGDTITQTKGIVSGFFAEDPLGNRAWVKTDTTISHGNSGGAVLNERGELVGVPTLMIQGCLGNKTKTTCIPSGDEINAFRPVNFAIPLIEKATGKKIVVADSTATPGKEPTAELLFWDDFANPIARWDTQDDSHGSKGVSEKKDTGCLRQIPDSAYWVGRIWHFRMCAWKRTGCWVMAPPMADTAWFADTGMRRITISSDRAGIFRVIGKLENGKETILDGQDDVSAVQPGPAKNHIQAICLGDTLTFSVNGEKVAEAQDDQWSAGDIGLFADGSDAGGVEAFFDTVYIHRPTS